MILSDIGNYLRQRGQASLKDIALHFDVPPAAIQGMLEVWVRKGRVGRSMSSASCGSSCSQCDPAATEIYQWLGVRAREQQRERDHSLRLRAPCER